LKNRINSNEIRRGGVVEGIEELEKGFESRRKVKEVLMKR